MPAVRHLGDGYEPHVDENSGVLTYSLPVDSSFISVDFSFHIRQNDLEVLRGSPYRRATLEVVAHTVLQGSLHAGGTKVKQADFDDLVASVLHAPPDALEQYIDRIDRDHHIAVRHYVDRIMARRSAIDQS